MLNIFWNGHDGKDKYKTQYMSAIFYHDDEQKAEAEQTKAEQEKKAGVKFVTVIAEAGKWHDAEDYHQKYRLRGHTTIFNQLALNDQQVITTHIAARLNGWLSGYGDPKHIDKEFKELGLTSEQAAAIKSISERTSPHC